MKDSGTALVYGGTGLQGRPIVEQLVHEGYQVRVLTRQPQPELGHGVEAVDGAFEDADSLVRATRGVSHVVLLLPLDFDVAQTQEWTRKVVQAAEKAGVKRLVFDTSAPVPEAPTGIAAIDVKVAAEAIVRAASIPWTIIRPTIYLGNLLAPWSAPAIVRDHVIAYPLPSDVALSWISWEDTALGVARALADPTMAGQTLDIGGASAVTGTELAATFSRVLGGRYSYAPIPLEGFELGLNQALGPPVGTQIAALYRWLDDHGHDQLSRLKNDNARLGLEPTPLEDWIKAQNWPAMAAG
jgi:NAD(P)H dehydrogenase (quinone)